MKTGEPTDTTFRDAASLAAVLGDIAVGVRELRLTRALSVELFPIQSGLRNCCVFFSPWFEKPSGPESRYRHLNLLTQFPGDPDSRPCTVFL